MCFTVNPNAPRWTQRIVYKVLKQHRNGVLSGPFYPKHYKLGEVKHRDAGPIEQPETMGYRIKAFHGIYVYNKLSAARCEADRHTTCKRVVVKCRVDPADQLLVSVSQSLTRSVYSRKGGRKTWAGSEQIHALVATYDKIIPLEIVK